MIDINNKSRRDVLKLGALFGAAVAIGGPTFATSKSKAQVLNPVDYESHWNDLVATYGDVESGTYYSSSEVQPTGVVEPQTNAAAETGTRAVSDEGHNWTPEPTPTPEPTTTASCSGGGIGSEGHCWTPTTSEPTPTPTPTPSPTPAPTPEPNDSPQAQISAPDVAMEGQTVTIDGSGSYDPDGSIQSYRWDLGDGTVKYGESISHSYSSPNNYSIELRVTDNDGAVDYANASLTVGPWCEMKYEFSDGTTDRHQVIATGTDEVEVRANGDRYGMTITDNDRSDLDSVMSSLTQSTPGPGSGASDTINIGDPGTSTTIQGSTFSHGQTDINYRFPEWLEPANDLVDRGFANWNSGGHAEAASQGLLVGATSSIAETYTQIELSGTSSIEADIEFQGDYLGYMSTFLGSADLEITGFIRDTTDETSSGNKEIAIEKGTEEHTSVGLFDQLDPRTTTFDETFENGSGSNIMAVEQLDPGHVYQIGVRVRATAGSFQAKPIPGNGAAVVAYLEGDQHENPDGDLWWSTDNYPDNWENNGRVNVSSITIQWEQYK